jgi:hypothetical protein
MIPIHFNFKLAAVSCQLSIVLIIVFYTIKYLESVLAVLGHAIPPRAGTNVAYDIYISIRLSCIYLRIAFIAFFAFIASGGFISVRCFFCYAAAQAGGGFAFLLRKPKACYARISAEAIKRRRFLLPLPA